ILLFPLPPPAPQTHTFPAFSLLFIGLLSAFFCPHGFGCRNQVISGNRIELEIISLELSLTLTGPRDKAFWVDYILIIPADKYDPDLKNEKPLDKSFHFINTCGKESFYIE
uniref:Uncharacterized protein n=1 Tax=Callorhinchus milii TaxID=7868 RepID=A0A4W3GWP4_CALMI